MKVTLQEVARLAGVSKATVSRVLNEKKEGVSEATRQRVLLILEELEYHSGTAGRRSPSSKTKIIGLIIPDVLNPFFPQLLQSVENCASASGYTVLLGNSNHSKEREGKYIAAFLARGVDGIILTTASDDYANLQANVKLLEKSNVPCVLMDREAAAGAASFGVYVDNEYGMFSACHYLIQKGHRRIAFISGPQGLSTSTERLTGYKMGLAHNKLPFDEALVKVGRYTMQSGYDAMIDLHKSKAGFSAVLAANDIMALGAMQALAQAGYRLPDDIEIIGFDNIEFSSISSPPLSTVEQPVSLMGQIAVERLIDLINGRELELSRQCLEPRLVLRGTTKQGVPPE